MRIGWRERAEAHALHWFVRAALRLAPPPRGLSWIDHVAARLHPLRDAEHALAMQRTLRSSGTCLSRSLTVAALLPDAEVVIGVDPWGARSVRAHAWVEVDGTRIDPRSGDEFVFGELARLVPRRVPRAMGKMSAQNPRSNATSKGCIVA
jgi:Transglutaminase-like superfamily